MSKTKAAIEFSAFKGAALTPVALNIHSQMSANAATFPDPPVAMPALLAIIGTFEGKIAAKASRATADIHAAKAARSALADALASLGNYVNFIAKGDAIIVSQSGFPSYTTARPPSGVPAAPANLRLTHGPVSTSITARCRPDRARSTNEAQVCEGDPNAEANWRHGIVFSGGKAILTGLTVGSTIWVRVRTVGAKGVMGAWSDPAMITVV